MSQIDPAMLIDRVPNGILCPTQICNGWMEKKEGRALYFYPSDYHGHLSGVVFPCVLPTLVDRVSSMPG